MMNSSHAAERQHGLTLVQWVFLFVAFMVGLGGSFVIREAFPLANADVIQTAALSSATNR